MDNPYSQLSLAQIESTNLDKREQTFSQHLFLFVDVRRSQHGRREWFLTLNMYRRLGLRLLLLYRRHSLRWISHIRRVLVWLRAR